MMEGSVWGKCVCIAVFYPYCTNARAEKMEFAGYCCHLPTVQWWVFIITEDYESKESAVKHSRKKRPVEQRFRNILLYFFIYLKGQKRVF